MQLVTLSAALRSVRVHPRPGEISAPVHAGAHGETLRHEVRPTGHHSYHRPENRYRRSASCSRSSTLTEDKLLTRFCFDRACADRHKQVARETGPFTPRHLPRSVRDMILKSWKTIDDSPSTTWQAAYFSPVEQLAAIPEFQGLGPLFKSSEPVQLTEAETEYVVRSIKHTFAGHMVFQFDCTNTLNDQLLQKVAAVTLCISRPSPPTRCAEKLVCFGSGGSADGAVGVLRGGALRPGR